MWKKVILLVIIATMALCGIMEGGTMTEIKVTPSSSSVKQGQVFTVEVSVTPDGEVAGLQMDFHFNPGVMQVQSVVQGPFLGQQTFFNAGVIDNTAGVVKPIYGVVTTPGQAITQPGVFLVITCKALAASGTSGIVLDNVVVGNKEGVSVPFSLSVSQVVVLSSYDLDGNGSVNSADMEIAASQFGVAGSADFNEDMVVDVLDLIRIGQHFTEA
jgi:hypothetical protein